MLVFNTINTSRTKENGLNENFRSYFKRGFHNFFRSLIYYNRCKSKRIKEKSTLASRKLIFARIFAELVQSLLFLSAHFLSFIWFLSIATCFDLLTVFLRISTCLLIASARFYLLTSRFYYFQLVYQLSVVSTRLQVISTHFYWFTSRFYSLTSPFTF